MRLATPLRPRTPRALGAALARRSSRPAAPRCARVLCASRHGPPAARARAARRSRRRARSGTSSRAPPDAALVAVGGYGRGQLFPHSDVDVLILLPGRARSAPAPRSSSASSACSGTSVSRSGTACARSPSAPTKMAADVTVQTSLLEHRLRRRLARAAPRVRRAMLPTALDVPSFYEAKMLEQQQRHLKYHDTAYNLEPNVKESPGGLRDLQTVLWIARAAGLGPRWRELAQAGLITTQEARTVSRQERLHRRAARAAALPRRTGARIGSCSTSRTRSRASWASSTRRRRRASEQLMQRYYRAAKLVRQVNVILLQNLHARLFAVSAEPVHDRRRVRRDRRAARRPRRDAVRAPTRARCSTRSSTMQRHPELKGMSARTLRALWRNRHRIDATFRRDQRQSRALHRDPARSRAASRTSCGG